jgi:peptidyl-prolyl cis-trans isomerase SurA
MRSLSLFLFCAALVASCTASAGTGERIVAVVGSDAITESELEDAITLLRPQLLSPAPEESLRSEILDQMIENRILVSQARAETVSVTHDEIEMALDQSIREIKARFATEEEFEKELELENTTLAELKERYRDEIEDRLMVQKLVEKNLRAGIRVSDNDLRNFYEAKKDSIPDQPETVKLAHILVMPKPSEDTDRNARDLVNRILLRIDQGADFAQLAKEYSADRATAGKGGDLGLIKRGELSTPEFEQTLFSLIPAEVTVTASPFGYHIVQCVERKENGVHARHILIPVLPSKSDTLKAERLANSLAARARAGEDFSELARQYSDDPQSREDGGELGVFATDELTAPFDAVVSSLKPGEVSDAVAGEFGFHVIKLEERTEGRSSSFEDVKDELRELIYQREMAEKYDKWISKLKKGIYTEKRL